MDEAGIFLGTNNYIRHTSKDFYPLPSDFYTRDLNSYEIPPGTSTYTITTTASEGGTINPVGTQQVQKGKSITFTIQPSTGYSVKDVRVDGASIGINTSFTFSNVTTGHNISVTFMPTAQQLFKVYQNDSYLGAFNTKEEAVAKAIKYANTTIVYNGQIMWTWKGQYYVYQNEKFYDSYATQEEAIAIAKSYNHSSVRYKGQIIWSSLFVPEPIDKDSKGGRISGTNVKNKYFSNLPASDCSSIIGHDGRSYKIHALAFAALQEMRKDAQAAGFSSSLLLPVSVFRTDEYQKTLWDSFAKKYPDPEDRDDWVARPGCSAHRTGRAIDFWLGYSCTKENNANIRKTDIYKWLVKNASKYGFYPYSNEAWHWEYNPPWVSLRKACFKTMVTTYNCVKYSYT
jgi:D-alanyl-D-alanine dipeptidase